MQPRGAWLNHLVHPSKIARNVGRFHAYWARKAAKRPRQGAAVRRRERVVEPRSASLVPFERAASVADNERPDPESQPGPGDMVDRDEGRGHPDGAGDFQLEDRGSHEPQGK